MHADTETKHAIRVREVLTGNNLFWLELSFPRERQASFAEKKTLDTNKFPNHEELSSVIWCNFAERSYVSLCVVYFFFLSSFFFLFSFLCDSWLGNGSGCFLEVVASSAGEKGGAYGSQDSHQVVSAQRKKETQTRETNGTAQYL